MNFHMIISDLGLYNIPDKLAIHSIDGTLVHKLPLYHIQMVSPLPAAQTATVTYTIML